MDFQREKDQPILKSLAVQKRSLVPAVNAKCQKDFWVTLRGVAVIPDKNKVPTHPFANPVGCSYKILYHWQLGQHLTRHFLMLQKQDSSWQSWFEVVLWIQKALT